MREETEKGIGLIPVIDTIVFEMKKQKKKLYFFLGVAILIAVLLGYLLQLIPGNLLSDTQAAFFSGGEAAEDGSFAACHCRLADVQRAGLFSHKAWCGQD